MAHRLGTLATFVEELGSVPTTQLQSPVTPILENTSFGL